MSVHKKDKKSSHTQDGYKEFLNFGHEKLATEKTPTLNVNDRIKNIVKKLQELNARIDKLNQNY